MVVVPPDPWTCSICVATDRSIFVVLACGHGRADDNRMHIACLWRAWTNGITAQLAADQINYVPSCPLCRAPVGDDAFATMDRQAFQQIDNPPNPDIENHDEELDGYRIAFENARNELARARAWRVAGDG